MSITLAFKGPPAHVRIDRQTCGNCGLCARACSSGPLVKRDGTVQIDPHPLFECMACGACVAACPTGSIHVEGRGMQADDALDLPEPRAGFEQLRSLLLARRSVRQFASDEVDRADMERVLEIAATAPMGLPPHEVGVVVFHGREKVRGLAERTLRGIRVARPWMNGLMLAIMRPFIGQGRCAMMKEFVVPYADLAAASAVSRDRLLYDAPAALLFHSSPTADPANAPIAATYAMLAAESLGLGTCLIGMVGPFLQRDRDWRKRHGIPPGHQLGLALIMGHPAVRPQRGLRRRLASVAWA